MDFTQYEFLDFGCSIGGSLKKYSKLFRAQGKGLGLDINPEKVKKANSNGHEAIVCDIRELKLSNCVRFILMSHFLEHLPGIRDVRSILAVACHAAREFVFIRQPYYDADTYLFRLGLKLYWSDWSGHPNNMTCLEFHNILAPMLRDNRMSRFCLYGFGTIQNSMSSEIHNLDSPTNQHDWDPEKHSEKRYVEFDLPVYREVIVLIDITGSNVDVIEPLFPGKQKLFDSRG